MQEKEGMSHITQLRYKWITLLVLTQFMLWAATAAFAAGSVTEAHGKITGKSRKAQTISLAQKDGSHLTVKYNDATQYINAKSSRYLRTKDAVKVEYKKVNGENIAITITRKLVKLPAGTKQITSKQVKAVIDRGQPFQLIDARPTAMYEQSHIPGAVSIPYSKLKTEGAKLLPFPKNQLLIFYCGGDT